MTELMARSFFETLHPLLRRLNTERTISPGKIGVLRHLTEHGRATTTELAAAVHVSPQGISLSVRELDRSGLVVKIPDSEDRRRIWIELTEEGRQRLLQESSSGREWLAQAIKEKLTPQERETLEAAIPVLRKLGSESLT